MYEVYHKLTTPTIGLRLTQEKEFPFVYGISWLENSPQCNAQCTYAAYLVFTSVLRKVPPRNVTTRDDGAYECQISTQSKMSHFVYLKVLGKHTTHTNNSLINRTSCKTASKVKYAPHQKRIFSNKFILLTTECSQITQNPIQSNWRGCISQIQIYRSLWILAIPAKYWGQDFKHFLFPS